MILSPWVEFSQEDLLFLQKEQNRNSVISLAYLENGYSKIEIANHLGLSEPAVSMVIKNAKSGDWTVGMLGRLDSKGRFTYLYN